MNAICPICEEHGEALTPCAQHPGWVRLPVADLRAGRAKEAGKTQESLLGLVIEDRYALTNVVGIGGIGVVYRARHLLLGQDRAIKFLKGVGDDASLRRFNSEARVTASLESPHSVHVHDFGLSDDGPLHRRPYLVMELVEGRSLAQHLRELGPMQLRPAAILLKHLADSLDEAHRLKIVHRDIKPGNIMLTLFRRRPRAKVIDFGIAYMQEGEDTNRRVAQGTPNYMSPEQWTAQPVDHRTDIYAVGVVLHRALAGRPPFKSQNKQTHLAELREQHLFQAPPPIPTVSEAVEAVIHRAMAKAPADRWDSLAQMSEAFFEAMGGFSPTPTGPIELPPTVDTLSEQITLERILETSRPAAPQPPSDTELTPTGLVEPEVEVVAESRWGRWVLLAALLGGLGGWWVLRAPRRVDAQVDQHLVAPSLTLVDAAVVDAMPVDAAVVDAMPVDAAVVDAAPQVRPRPPTIYASHAPRRPRRRPAKKAPAKEAPVRPAATVATLSKMQNQCLQNAKKQLLGDFCDETRSALQGLPATPQVKRVRALLRRKERDKACDKDQ